MNLHNLEKLTDRSKKRVGRGLGSGKGKTAGRGQKGQKARGHVPAYFTGGGVALYKKLPLLRGWGNPTKTVKPIGVNLAKLAVFKNGEKVTLESLISSKLVTPRQAKTRGVKILGDGELKLKLDFMQVQVSKSAREKIEKAGGSIE